MQKYVVGFIIADARNLKPEGEGTCDPFVVVQCCGRTYRTEVKENKRVHVPINERQMWNDIELNEEKFETAFIEFRVYARNFWWRDYLIGKASFQLSSINRRKAHVYFKKTVPLRRDNDPENTGSITLTVWCLKPGQSAPTLSQMEDQVGEGGESHMEDELDLTKDVLGEQNVQFGALYQLMVNIFRVEDLAKVQGRDPSPFVTVEFGGVCMSTEEAHNTAQYTFNNEIRIPVQQPICEDVILIKLWHKGNVLTLKPDTLLAQGLISFSELRNHSLPPRWFCLYGWDSDEVNVEDIARTGERIKPNAFKGRLLISGRVERVKDIEELKDANTSRAQQPVEPEMKPVALFADVYQVIGAVGKECQVRLSFGALERQTDEWVKCTRRAAEVNLDSRALALPALDDAVTVDETKPELEDMVSFQFNQRQGRIKPLLDMTPEDPEAQPFVMVNVYTRGIMSGELRVGYQMKRLSEFSKYDPGSPGKPKFVALEPMPNSYSVHQRINSSVLIVIEQHTTDDVQRHDRKNVKPAPCIIRAYIFMGRNIESSHKKSYAVRVTCAGVSKRTQCLNDEVRPMWMKCLELPIMLCSDHKKEQPTMFPVTLALCDPKFLPWEKDIGKTVCVYEYMRRKDTMDRWEPFHLTPQWIQLKGGSFGSKVTGEVLVAFELLHARDRSEKECQQKPMWPAASDADREDQHFAYLRKATLHVAMYGLRDLKLRKPPVSMDEEYAPKVQVRVKKFSERHRREDSEESSSEDQGSEESPQPSSNRRQKGGHNKPLQHYVMDFKYRSSVSGDKVDKDKENKLLDWKSDALGFKDNLNYEVLQVQKMPIKLPDKVLLQPAIEVRVMERGYVNRLDWLNPLKGKFDDNDWLPVGSYRQSLGELYPCMWLKELYCNSKSEIFQEQQIIEAVTKARQELEAKPKFTEESKEEREQAIRAAREREFDKERTKIELRNGKKLIQPEEKPKDLVDTGGNALQICDVEKVEKREQPLPLRPMNLVKLNMYKGLSFQERVGEKSHKKNQSGTQQKLDGKLESRSSTKKYLFTPDFFFENRPLLKDWDLIDPDTDDHDWNYYHKECFGFVKCAFKLTDGWEEEEEAAGGPPQGNPNAAPPAAGLPAVEDGREEAKLDLVNGHHENRKHHPGGHHHHHHHHGGGQLMNEDGAHEHAGLIGLAGMGSGLVHHGAQALLENPLEKVAHAAAQGAAQGMQHVVDAAKEVIRENYGQGDGELAIEANKGDADKAAHVSRAWEQTLLRSSFGLSEELEEFAFNGGSAKFAKRFKGHANLPSRVRVRIYFVKAICIMGKPGDKDPYLCFKLGQTHDVSMRNMYEKKTSEPRFYRVEERDIVMPQDGRLQVNMFDHVGEQNSSMFGSDVVIGSTTIDLEDRWHSRAWKDINKRKAIPPEQRPLYNSEMPGQNCGSLEMWVEMLDSIKASEEKATDLRKPNDEQVEVRIVIWSALDVPLLDGSGADMYSDVQVSVKLECSQYKGEKGGSQDLKCPREQFTDVHNHCTTGHAIFNWRIVFPRITVPTESCTIDVTLIEVDTLSTKLIGQVTVDIRKYVEKVGRDMERLHTKANLKMQPVKSIEDGEKKEEEQESAQHSQAGCVQLEMLVLTQAEANQKRVGMRRDPPNDDPPLTTPAEGRGWSDVFPAMAWELPSFGLFWKVVPLILFTLLCLVGLRYIGLL